MSMKTLPILPTICCGPETQPLGQEARHAVAARFKGLAAADEVCVCDLNAAFDLSQPTISHHLRILREAGLVDSTRRGTWAFYKLVPEAIESLRGALGG